MDMDKRLRDMPVMAQRDDQIDARYYNIWRRARSRWGAPMRVPLPGLKEINMILSDEYWVCIDTVRYDSPIIAWVDLEDGNRDAMHLPINCHLNYYHFAASAIRARSLEVIEQVMSERLRKK
jgi:hypothetical protein